MADIPTPPEEPDPDDTRGGREPAGEHPEAEEVPVVEVDE
jgi:hypothetical protein